MLRSQMNSEHSSMFGQTSLNHISLWKHVLRLWWFKLGSPSKSTSVNI